MTDNSEITQALDDFERGEEGAFENLVSLVYGDLRQLAQIQLAKRRARDLQTTALVHELYLKLVDRKSASWSGRNHFYAACATAMRNIIIDSARAAQRQKRGGGEADLSLIETLLQDRAGTPNIEYLLSIEQVLQRLGEKQPQLAKIFELRYFGGYSANECADILGVSARTVDRRWKRACGWIHAAAEDRQTKYP